MALSLQELFNKYAGKEVKVAEVTYQTKDGPRPKVVLLTSDTVVPQLRKDIESSGKFLLLLLEGNQYPQSLPGATVPVFVTRDADHKYRINQIGIGAAAFKR